MRNVFTTMTGNGCVRHCQYCKTDENVEWSDRLQFYCCDECYEEAMIALYPLEANAHVEN